MSQQEKMKHGAKRSLFLLLEREGLGETEREKGEEIGRQGDRQRYGKKEGEGQRLFNNEKGSML